MKIVAWNCRGLGNRSAVRGLLGMQKSEGADILFLSETKLDERRMQKFRWLLGLPNMLVQNGEGKGGGIAVMWRRGVDVSLRHMSKYYIDLDVTEMDGAKWRFTGIYGESHADQKHKTWEAMRSLAGHPGGGAWMCAGDFNEILFVHEKEGGRQKPQSCLDRFKLALEDCDLSDLGFEGDCFTWRNHSHIEDDYIRERLDRAVANDAWRGMFPGLRVINGDPRHSDHRPVIILTETERHNHRRKGGGFRFEASWIEEEKCKDIVERTWKDALEQGEGSVVGALKAVAGGLKNWSSNILGDLEKRAKKLKKELEFCRKREITKEQVAREGVLRYRLEKVEEQIDVYWRQRAHVRWLKEGDRNTAFFHAACSERRRCNKIGRIQKDDGSWVEEEEEKKAFIANYFLNLFRSDVQGDSQQILDTVERKVTSTMNEMLLAPFTEVDIKEALDSIGDLKAPGPDGMPAIFYKNFWSTVGRKVVEEVMQVLNGGDMPAS